MNKIQKYMKPLWKLIFVDIKLLNVRKKNKWVDFVWYICKMKLHLNSFLNTTAIVKKTCILCVSIHTMYCTFMCIFHYVSSHYLLQNKETNIISCVWIMSILLLCRTLCLTLWGSLNAGNKQEVCFLQCFMKVKLASRYRRLSFNLTT